MHPYLLPLAFSPPANVSWVFVLIGAVFGYQVPGFWLMRKTAKRQKEIQNGLPDLLDLLIVCLEAGSALARDPANAVLRDLFSRNYQQKVELLRRATALTQKS